MKKIGNIIDETGNKYGAWTVLKLERINGILKWDCVCECGTHRYITGADLRRGHTKSCGCKSQNKNRLLDLTGQKFGRLTVMHLCEKKYYGNRLWHCKCDCGNETNVDTSRLIKGITKSCGCIQKEVVSDVNKIDLTGKKFGLWTVLEEIPQRVNNRIYYKCQCECGTIKNVVSENLSNGTSQSCGCLKMSHGEFKITNLLKDNNIDFIPEFHPNDFKAFQNARYDFYIPKLNTLIEYDGRQHFVENNAGWDDSLEDIQKRDEEKNKWAKENGFILIRIPYTHYDNLCIEDLIPTTSKFIHTNI